VLEAYFVAVALLANRAERSVAAEVLTPVSEISTLLASVFGTMAKFPPQGFEPVAEKLAGKYPDVCKPAIVIFAVGHVTGCNVTISCGP